MVSIKSYSRDLCPFVQLVGWHVAGWARLYVENWRRVPNNPTVTINIVCSGGPSIVEND